MTPSAADAAPISARHRPDEVDAMTKERRTRMTRILLAAAIVSACALAWGPAAMAAAKDGISGTVVNGTTDAPAANQEVTLSLFDQQTQTGTSTATTDADGAFSFAAPPEGTQGYQVSTTYADVIFRSPPTQYTPGQPAEVTLNVYETTTDAADVTLASWIVWVDQEGEGAAVQHDLQWSNGGDSAYVGEQTAPDGSPITTQVPLEPGASNPQFLGLYLDTPGQTLGDRYVNSQALVPGDSSATVRYNVSDLSQLTLPVTLPTTTLQLFVPTGVTVTAEGLTTSGEVTDRGITYQVFNAQNLKAGDTLRVELSGLTGGGARSPLLWVGIGIVVIAALGGIVAWLLLRRRARRQQPVRKGAVQRGRQPQDPAKNGRPRQTPAARRAELVAAAAYDSDDDTEVDVDEQFDLLIDEIAALDLAHEKGLIEQDSYETLRAAAKGRLLRLREARTGGRPAR
jgi:hypothetical protein